MIPLSNFLKSVFTPLSQTMLATILSVSSIANAEDFREKLTAEQTKSIWLKSCGSSLLEAQSRYGSKITFPSKRDRQAFIDDVCNKAVDEQLKLFAKMKKLPPEAHACMYLADRDDLINGFGKNGQNSIPFAFGYCNNL